MKGLLWDPADTERLGVLVASGRSPLEVAAEFPGRSRNAILGHADRQGFHFFSRSSLGSSNKIKNARIKKAMAPRRHKVTTEERAELVASLEVGEGMLMEELNDKVCAYPVTDTVPFRFCGKERKKGCYCEVHAAITHQHTQLARL